MHPRGDPSTRSTQRQPWLVPSCTIPVERAGAGHPNAVRHKTHPAALTQRPGLEAGETQASHTAGRGFGSGRYLGSGHRDLGTLHRALGKALPASQEQSGSRSPSCLPLVLAGQGTHPRGGGVAFKEVAQPLRRFTLQQGLGRRLKGSCVCLGFFHYKYELEEEELETERAGQPQPGAHSTSAGQVKAPLSANVKEKSFQAMP